METLFKKTRLLLLVLSITALLAACSNESSIYDGIGAEGDGVIAIKLLKNNDPVPDEPTSQQEDVLSETEQKLVNNLHKGEAQKLSFIVIDVEEGQVMRSYLAKKPRRLASVSKLITALTALEEVNNVEAAKIRSMLKKSNNGEASRYVRLSAKAINGTITPGRPYTHAHSCPGEFLDDAKAAHVVQDWLMDKVDTVDWTDASFRDGAGCSYKNMMNSLQIAHILAFADSKGKAYAGMSFEQLLSIGGVDGTLKSRNKDHKGKIFAKTGTLNPNSNLAGYFYAKRDGKMKKYYFTVFIQKKGSGAYTRKARKLIESLLRYWINYYAVNRGEPVAEFKLRSKTRPEHSQRFRGFPHSQEDK